MKGGNRKRSLLPIVTLPQGQFPVCTLELRRLRRVRCELHGSAHVVLVVENVSVKVQLTWHLVNVH